MQTTELLVIGSGPFGLAASAHAKLSGIGVTVVGESMAFWEAQHAGWHAASLRT